MRASPDSCFRRSATPTRAASRSAFPYYFNLAPNYDLTLTPFLLSRRGFGLGAEYRYLTERSRGKLDTDYLPGDDLAGRDRRLSTLVAPDRSHRSPACRCGTRGCERQQLFRGLRPRSRRHEHHIPRSPCASLLARQGWRLDGLRAGLPGDRHRRRSAGPPVLAPAADRIHGPLAPASRLRGVFRCRDRLVRAG